MAWLMTSPMAVVSSACVAPAPVSWRIASTTSSLAGSMVAVAPSSAAIRRLSPTGSTAMIVLTLATLATMTADRPTAPAPYTTSAASLVGRKHVEDGAGAGLHAAAQRRGDAQIDVITDEHEIGLVGQGMRRKARLPKERP